jgi:uncharacterized protein YcbK (DUF882 family)
MTRPNGPEDPGDLQIAPHLFYREVRCKTTLSGMVCVKVLNGWAVARGLLGVPITIVSGYRSIKHQKILIARGVKTALNSYHTYGMALDLACTLVDLESDEVLKIFHRGGFKGIIRGGGRFHIDVRPDLFVGKYDPGGSVTQDTDAMDMLKSI